MIRIAEFSHRFFLEKEFHDKILVDMTCGQGQDTLFLVGLSMQVYAFDIQNEAIESTKS